MNVDEALKFLQEHQPLPPSRAASSNDVIGRFNEIRGFFAVHKDERCVPLLLNAFGEGDGHGVYQLVENTILAYPEDFVVSAICDCLNNPKGSVRFYNAMLAGHYKHRKLIGPLENLLKTGNTDEQFMAAVALERMMLDTHWQTQDNLSFGVSAEDIKAIISGMVNSSADEFGL